MDIQTALLAAIGALASAVVLLWKYTEARLDKVVLAYNERLDTVVSAYTAELLQTRKDHREEIKALSDRLDLAEEGRRKATESYGNEMKGLTMRSIAAHHESSQAIRSMADAVRRIPCQNIAPTPMEQPAEKHG